MTVKALKNLAFIKYSLALRAKGKWRGGKFIAFR